MGLTSITQARQAYTGLFVGLYVGLGPAEQGGYESIPSIELTLLSGVLAAVFGLIVTGAIFAFWFEDRFWRLVFWAAPFAFLIGLALSFVEGAVTFFFGQPLIYAAFAAFLGSVLGFWLHMLLCCRGKRDGSSVY